MKRRIKILLLASTLSIAGTISSFAFDGWKQENSKWTYYKNDSKVYNTWAKSAAGDWYYIDSDGYMAVNKQIDGDYCVDQDGKMVVDAWRLVDNKWYYYDSNGKSVQNKSRQIKDQWYYFGSDGMLTGWIEDNGDYYYYDQTSGKRYSDVWIKNTPPEDADELEDSGGPEDDGKYWFYLRSTGKMAKAEDSEFKEFIIGDNRYAFDEYGRMRTGWVKLEDTSPVIAGYKYYNDTDKIGSFGAAHTGWLATEAPEGESGFSSDTEWYYFDSKGKPYYGSNLAESSDDEMLQAKLKKLQSAGGTHKFLFNEFGNPVYGLRKVKRSNGEITSMYFGTKAESCLQLGDKNIEDADGVKSSFYFDSAGYGYTGVKNGKLYYMGKLQRAEDDTYAYYTVEGKTYLVNKNGQIRKNYNKNKDSDEVDYRSDGNGYKNGGNASDSELLVPAFMTSEY